jgi:hypothetical protein
MMKKLLITTALVALAGSVTAASAETVYVWTVTTPAVLGDDPSTTETVETTYVVTPASTQTFTGSLEQFNAATNAVLVRSYDDETNSLAGQQASLLDSLLADAEKIQVSLANTSENLANINGSLNLDIKQQITPDVTAGTTTGVTIVEPLTAKLGNLTTTVIGSLGNGTVDMEATLANVTAVNQAMTANSDALNAQFAPSNQGLAQVYNLSSNLGALDASLNVDLEGVSLALAENIAPTAGIAGSDGIEAVAALPGQIATWSTTAIGSLGTGEITSTVVNNATGLTERLVGSN